jgi:hypothetical protein
MPKENTHTYFAEKVLSKIQKEDPILAGQIQERQKFYLLGSYSPDVFFYSKNPENKKISDFIHGHEGEKTNITPIKLAEKIKQERNPRDEIFLYGFLTHMAMDIVFHPIIFYLTGNPYSENKEQNPKNFHRHRQLETALDRKLHSQFKLLDPQSVDIPSLKFASLLENKFNVSQKEILETYQKHYSNNLLFRRKYLYYLILFLNKINILKISDLLGLFYPNAKKIQFPEKIKYKDLFNGKTKETTLKKLFKEAENLSKNYILTVRKFLNDEISKKDVEEVIQGQNLDTGVVGKTAKEINYTKFN